MTHTHTHTGTNEPFMIMTLPIPKKKDLRLYDCLEHLLSQNETLSESNAWHCERCDEDVLATRSTSIWYLPDTLVFCLKRFQGNKKEGDDDDDGDKKSPKKITSPIEYPVRGLDMSRFWRCDCTWCLSLSLSLSIEILNSLSLFVLERKVRKSRDVEEYNVQMPKTRAQNQNLYTIYVL